MNSLTHSPLAAAISLKIGRVEILHVDDGEGHGDMGDMSQEDSRIPQDSNITLL